MKISTKGRYALRVMIDLAINSNANYISLKDIAARQEISNKYLEQIIAMLNKAGYLETARGNSGGYSRKEDCKTHSFWKGLDKVINEYVDSKTLEDLIK